MRVEYERDEIDILLDDYQLMFSTPFPSVQLGLDESIIKSCLRQGKDVYELEYLKHDDNMW